MASQLASGKNNISNDYTVEKKVIDFHLYTEPVHQLWAQKKKEIIQDLQHRQVLDVDEILNLQYALPPTRPKKWINRIIFEVDGVKFGKSLDGSKPKYITEPNFKLAEQGFPNVSNVDTLHPIVVAEGLIDFLSLPKEHAILAPGTASLSGDHIFSLLNIADKGLIIAPDYDKAGVMALLRILNRQTRETGIKIFFSGLIDKGSNDLNDLKMKGLTRLELYDIVVGEALGLFEALDRISDDYNIIKRRGKFVLKEEDGHGKDNYAENKVQRPGDRFGKKEGRIKQFDPRYNRPPNRRNRNVLRRARWF